MNQPETNDNAVAEVSPPAIGRTTAKALREQMSRDRLAQKWLTGGATVSVVLFLFLFYVPSRSTLANLRARIGTDGRQLAQDTQRVGAVSNVKAAVGQLRAQVADFKALPDDPELYEFTQKVTDLSQPLELRAFKCTPEMSYTNGELGVWPVRLNFQADSFSTLALMQQIEGMPRSLRIRELSMRRAPASPEDAAGSNQIEVKLVVNLYYKIAEEPE